MDPDDSEVAMIYQDPHPAHRGFAEAINADLIDYHRLNVGLFSGTVIEDGINGMLYPNYDVYLVEGSRPLYAALTRRLLRGGKLVYLAADHGLYQLGSNDFRGDSIIKSLFGRFGRPAARVVGRRGIDGVIAVSEFVAEFTRMFTASDTPIEVAHPFIQPANYNALVDVNPALDENVAVTVARPWRYKGVDLLVDAWPRVRSMFPNAQLHVVGKGHPDSYADTPGVCVKGYVEQLADAFTPASLFVQPSRVDAFPVTTLEAMRAGLPPLVTHTAGTRSEARRIDDSFVVEATAESLSNGICQYFEREINKRREFASRARARGRRFDAETRTAAFNDTFRSILKAL